jgi:hypothetical protein
MRVGIWIAFDSDIRIDIDADSPIWRCRDRAILQ